MKLSKIYKAKTYQKSERLCPKGYRMPYLWELIKLIEEGKGENILNHEKGEWRWFWCKQNKNDKKEKIIHGLGRYTDGSWLALWYDLAYSNADGRVIFVKEDINVKNI